jgi:DNA-binding SARP family transcriptional activator
MPRYRLHLLGTPRISGPSGEETGFPVGKPLALLALVALEPQGLTRDDAAALLWPASSRHRGRASVRQALWTLRKQLDPQVVTEAPDGSLEIDRSRLELDLDELGVALTQGDATAVIRLWSGGPFKGFALPDAPGWNQWATDLHARWERRVGGFLEDHAASLPIRDRLPWIERGLEVRPYRDTLHTLRIRTLLELGWLEEARAALSWAREQVGDAAEGNLDDLDAELRAAVRGRYGTEAPDPLNVSFVGRSAEFAALSDLLETVRRGESRSVAIIGAPGIGKTRLAREFTNVCQASGARVVEARGVSGERRVEYGVAGSLVRDLLPLPGAAGISNASAEVLQSLAPSRGNGSKLTRTVPSAVALGDAVADLVAAVAEEAPLVLLVDDLHWADDPSRTLLQRAMRFVRDRPVLLVQTCRTELGDETVLRTLRAEGASGRLELLTLTPLGEADVAQLLIQLADFSSEEEAAEAGVALYRASRGHPLHLVALLRNLKAEGVLEERGDEWVFHMQRLPQAVEMPSELQGLLAARLMSSSSDARAILDELVSRPGGANLYTLRRASNLPEERFAAGMSELFDSDLVGWSGGDRIDFSHDLLRQAVGEGRHARSASTWVRRLAAVVAVGALGALAWAVRSEPGTSPWADSEIQIELEGGLFLYRPLRGLQWAMEDSIHLPPAEGGTFRPFHPLPGRAVLGQWRETDRGPDVARLAPSGALEIVFDGGGDDGILGTSPDGAHLLLTSEDTGASQYQRDLLLLDLPSGQWARILDSDFAVQGAFTSDGRSIMAGLITLSGPDELVWLRPDGTVLERAVMPVGDILDVQPCGPRGTLFLFQRTGELQTWQEWDWEAGRLVDLPLQLGRAFSIGCSPDGAYRAVLDDNRADEIRILDAATFDQVGRIPLSGRRPRSELRWILDRADIPASVVAAAPDSIAWGEVAEVSARIFDHGGEPLRVQVTWTSLDPEVVGVRGDSVVGNRPGVGRVVAAVDGWITDTVTVRVSESATGDLLLGEDFQDLSQDRWLMVGDPGVRLVEFQDTPVLDVGGDAVWNDGIRSLEPQEMDQGLTVAVEFRLPLTDRRDRQSIRICLVDALESPDPTGLEGFDELSYCVMYPQGELNMFDSGALALRGPPYDSWVRGFPAPGLGTGDWATLGLQVQPDGRMSAVVNGEEVGTYPEPVEVSRDRDMNLVIYGRGEDTRLFLRRVTLWRGARY